MLSAIIKPSAVSSGTGSRTYLDGINKELSRRGSIAGYVLLSCHSFRTWQCYWHQVPTHTQVISRR